MADARPGVLQTEDLASEHAGLAVPAATARREIQLVAVTHYFPAHGGGLERVAQKLVEGLADRGYKINWFSSGTDPTPPFESTRITTTSVRTFNFIERLTQLPYPFWSPSAMAGLWRAIGTSQLVHVHEHLYFPSIVAMAIARMRDRPVVVTQHIGALGLRSRLTTLAYELGARLLGTMLFPFAARVVFISNNVQAFFGRADSATSRLIFNGVDTNRFSPATEQQRVAARLRLGLPTDRRILLFVGRFVRKKGLHRIAALAQRVEGVHWILIGSGPERPPTGLPNVHVAGRVEHDLLPDYYCCADLLVLPSSGEGMPLVVQEALCCGVGVLSTDEVASACPDARDMIVARPVPKSRDDLPGWEATLRMILQNEEYLSEAARSDRARRARSLWSWDRCVGEYDEMFRAICEAP